MVEDRKEYARRWRAQRTPEQKAAEKLRKAAWYASLSREQKNELASRPHRKSEKAKKRKNKYTEDLRLLKCYGITSAIKAEILLGQESKCANAGCQKKLETPRDKHVDHDHVTGHVRGILCNNCNAALGLLKDNVERLRGLIDYINFYQSLVDKQY